MKTILKIMLLTGGTVAVGYYLNKKGYIQIKNGKISVPAFKKPEKPRIVDKEVKSTPQIRPGGGSTSAPTQRAI